MFLLGGNLLTGGVDKPPPPDAKDSDFQKAVDRGDAKYVDEVLKLKGTDVKQVLIETAYPRSFTTRAMPLFAAYEDRTMRATPLFVAALNDDLNMARVLLRHGADPNKSKNHDGTVQDDILHNATPLWFAIWESNTDFVKLLLTNEYNKANLNITYPNRSTPLGLAQSPNPNPISAVREITQARKEGRTLAEIRQARKVEMVELLLQNAANPNTESQGNTPLYHAVQYLIEDLEEMYFNLDVSVSESFVEQGYQVVELLIKYGADPNTAPLAKLLYTKLGDSNEYADKIRERTMTLILTSPNFNSEAKNNKNIEEALTDPEKTLTWEKICKYSSEKFVQTFVESMNITPGGEIKSCREKYSRGLVKGAKKREKEGGGGGGEPSSVFD